ncbi:unnamed protein product, partial [Adineta steineri]
MDAWLQAQKRENRTLGLPNVTISHRNFFYTGENTEENNRKRKSRWNASAIKQEADEHKFVQQIHEATEKAKSFVAQLNEQMKLYPEGYDATKMKDTQYNEQKELQSIYQTMMVKRRELEKLARQQHNKR